MKGFDELKVHVWYGKEGNAAGCVFALVGDDEYEVCLRSQLGSSAAVQEYGDGLLRGCTTS